MNSTQDGLTPVLERQSADAVLKRKLEQTDLPSPSPRHATKRRRRNEGNILTELHVSALKKDVGQVRKIIQEEKIDVDATDNLGNSALHIASGSGSVEVCRLLISLGAKMDLRNRNGLTPFHLSIRHNQFEAFILFIESRADVHVGNVDGITPLHMAAKYGRKEFMIQLLSYVQNVNPPDIWGQTPLHYSVLQKDAESAELLLHKGAKMEKDNTGMTPLLSAASVGATKSVQVLLKFGASLHDTSRSGKTALHLASQKGHYQTLECLLRQGVGSELLNVKCRAGLTPLMEAKASGHVDCMNLLLATGAGDTKPDAEDLKCAICYDFFYKPITIACGHTFCRCCLQSWRKLNDSCPKCRDPVRMVEGYSSNQRIDAMIAQYYPEASAARKREHRGNSMESTIQNMVSFGRALGKEVTLDKNHCCILAIDNEFPMHVTFLPRKHQLFIYAPIVPQFPTEPEMAMKVYQTLLNESFMGQGFAGAGVGLIAEKELIVLHVELDMCHAPEDALKQTSMLFVETVKKWRRRMSKLLKGEATDSSMTSSTKKFTTIGVPADSDVAEKNISEFLTKQNEGLTITKVEELKTGRNERLVYIQGSADHPIETASIYYDTETDSINIYSPIVEDMSALSGHMNRSLFEKLLKGSVFGFKTVHGGLGFVKDEGVEKLMLYSKLKMQKVEPKSTQGEDQMEMDLEYSTSSLAEFMPTFIHQLGYWKDLLSSHVVDAEKDQ